VTSFEIMGRSHKIDIGGLLASPGQHMLVDDEVPIEPFEGIEFAPARVHLELGVVDRMLCVEGTVDARATGACDSCLEDVDRELHVEIEERFDPRTGREIDPFGESNVLIGERLDVADLAQQVVLSEWPMGLRCSDDCKGLCAICGANRNSGPCPCDNGDHSGKSQMEDAAQQDA
jgi:uncharacterized protein